MKGVKDALRRLDGVGNIAVDLQTNLVTITPAPDVELALAAIPAAIERAGFTPGEMRLVARGTLVPQHGETVLRIRGWTSVFPVRGGAAAAKDVNAADDEVELRARVRYEGELVLEPLDVPR